MHGSHHDQRHDAGESPGLNSRLQDLTNADIKPDTLTRRELANLTGISMDFVRSHKEINDLFLAALDGTGKYALDSDLGKQRFINDFQQTAWFTENSQYARNYLYAQSQGGENFAEQVRAAKAVVQQNAVQQGAVLDERSLDFFAEQYLMNGWSDRPQMLAQALTGQLSYTDSTGKLHEFNTDFLDYTKGGAAAIVDTLRKQAIANGIQYNDQWYQSAARAITGGLATLTEYTTKIQDMAISSNPSLADQIRAGQTLSDLALPYIEKLAAAWDLDRKTIDLTTPEIKQAMAYLDPATQKVRQKSLWEFEQDLRKDPRWDDTKQGQKELADAGMQMMRELGFWR